MELGGTVFKITPSGTLTTLYSFCSRMSCVDGSGPSAGLVQASDGNFYGTTVDGGAYNLGTVFQITPAGTLTTLHSFCAGYPCDDGSLPYSTLVQATDGRFYGTAYGDGANRGGGTVFRLDAGISVFLLSVNKDGNGTVTSADGHINCGSTCSYAYKPGSVVTLTATPDQGWAFAGWTGCDNSQANVCTLTMNKLRTVTAIFKPLYALSVNKTGNGTISSVDGHIYCGSVCSYSYIDGTPVTLSALPSSGYTFTGWTGCDNMNGSYCSVTMTSAKNVTATFTTANITLTSLTFKPTLRQRRPTIGGNAEFERGCSSRRSDRRSQQRSSRRGASAVVRIRPRRQELGWLRGADFPREEQHNGDDHRHSGKLARERNADRRHGVTSAIAQIICEPNASLVLFQIKLLTLPSP